MNSRESYYDRKISYEMEDVVEDNGIGWCFFSCPSATLRMIGVIKALKNVDMEPLASAVGVAAVLHECYYSFIA